MPCNERIDGGWAHARKVVEASRIAHMMMCALRLIICAEPLGNRSAGLSARMKAVQLLLAVLACGELTRTRDTF